MTTALEAVLKRDRAVVLTCLVVLAVLAWAYLFHLAADMPAMTSAGGADPSPAAIAPVPSAGGMDDMPGMAMPSNDMPGMTMPAAEMPGMDMGAASASASAPQDGIGSGVVFLAGMWMVMMVGMMLPSASATILLFAALERKQHATGLYGRTGLFVAGYFLVWAAFSVVAAAAQAVLSHAGLMSMTMAVTSSIAGGVVFVLAGLYEFSPLKDRCLSHCRSPMQWIAHHHRPGRGGALRMGAEHGFYCVGCCWMLMLLLFVGGVMNLLWVAAIAAVVLVEKLLPGGPIAARVAGAILVVAGVALIAQPLLFA